MNIKSIIRRLWKSDKKQNHRTENICTHADMLKHYFEEIRNIKERKICINGVDVKVGMFVSEGWNFSTDSDNAWGIVIWVNPNEKAKDGDRLVVMLKEQIILSYTEAVEYCRLYSSYDVERGQAFLLSEKDWDLFKLNESTPDRETMENSGIYCRRHYWTADAVNAYKAKCFVHLCYYPDDAGTFDFLTMHKSILNYVKIAVRY